jgi:hypothetical protein
MVGGGTGSFGVHLMPVLSLSVLCPFAQYDVRLYFFGVQYKYGNARTWDVFNITFISVRSKCECSFVIYNSVTFIEVKKLECIQ